MLRIKDIVNVVINRETTSKTVRDLQTIAVLSVHDRFQETHRKYRDPSELLDDGFLTTDFAYIAAERIFSQNPQVREIVVGRIEPSDGVDYVEGIRNFQASTEEWFFLITDAESDSDKLAIAAYIETQTAVYVYSDKNPLTVTADVTDVASQIKELGYTKSFGLYTKQNTVAPEAAWVGRFGSATIGSNVWVYKPLVGLSADGYTATEMSYLNDKNLQYYTKVGQDAVVAGNAVVGAGEKIHVILGVIWLEVRIAERYWNLLRTKERILFTDAGIELFRAELVTVLNEAVANNILTNEEPIDIKVPSASSFTSQERASGKLRRITFRARLAGAILFVDAVEGTVYA